MMHFAEYLFASLERIERRLGSERKNTLLSQMKDALAHQNKTNAYEGHRVWIQCLLSEYYDPMYDYQLSKKADRVVLRGDKNTLIKELIK